MRHPVKSVQTCVLFDFGGTLDANGIPWKERFWRLYRDQGVDISAEHFDPAFYAADDALVGTIPSTLPLQATVSRLVRRVSQALGLGDGLLVDRIATRFCAESREQLARNTVLLSQLSRRYRLGVVSNFYGNLVTVCHEAGLSPFLTVVVDSVDVGYVKPDPRIFLAALTVLQANPAQALFVGDSLRRDMAGARAVGMPHVWLTPAIAPGDGPCCPDDRVVRTLDELREWLL